MLNNRTTAHGDTPGPFLLTDFLKTALFPPAKLIIGPILRGQIAFSNAISDIFRGPTPLLPPSGHHSGCALHALFIEPIGDAFSDLWPAGFPNQPMAVAG